ncbi:POK18 protein, partial [Ceuthmochares aereus]|nr:POK18 protein [Ceuthmochares aereus]
NQWPLSKEKVAILQQLILEQLELGHIKESVSPWDTPVFMIPKKSGKWRLLHDLRKINAVMEDMGALQPGLPLPTMIPRHWNILIIDLKDCYFTIPICSEDSDKFAFSVPQVNKQVPMKRYQWVVLPQGMKNSPMICQQYVAKALEPFRRQHPHLIVLHYMDDILIVGQDQLEQCQMELVNDLQQLGLSIAPEKVQAQPPWKYLGWKILDQTVVPQKLPVWVDIKTLNDVQKMLGNINWVQSLLGIDNQRLKFLFNLLKGNTDLNAPRKLTKEAEWALEQIERAIEQRQAHRVVFEQPVHLLLINNKVQPLFLKHQMNKTIVTRPEAFAMLIIRGRERVLEIRGYEPDSIIIPMKEEHLQWYLKNNLALQVALENYTGQLKTYHRSSKLITFLENQVIVEKTKLSQVPVQGQTVFTEGSGRTEKVVIVWLEEKEWKKVTFLIQASPQIIELKAVVEALNKWTDQPLNVITDSIYVAGIVQRMERSILKEVSNQQLFELLKQLLQLLNQRRAMYYVCHHWSHTSLPGF